MKALGIVTSTIKKLEVINAAIDDEMLVNANEISALQDVQSQLDTRKRENSKLLNNFKNLINV